MKFQISVSFYKTFSTNLCWYLFYEERILIRGILLWIINKQKIINIRERNKWNRNPIIIPKNNRVNCNFAMFIIIMIVLDNIYCMMLIASFFDY